MTTHKQKCMGPNHSLSWGLNLIYFQEIQPPTHPYKQYLAVKQHTGQKQSCLINRHQKALDPTPTLAGAKIAIFSENPATHLSRPILSGHKTAFICKVDCLDKQPPKIHWTKPQLQLWTEIAIFLGNLKKSSFLSKDSSLVKSKGIYFDNQTPKNAFDLISINKIYLSIPIQTYLKQVGYYIQIIFFY